ncbi:hypothetical protein ACUNV4_30120 [Granulosicoccus sp. 3-233]|uniref:hypothetical protein n=1 Tax=Granulosicoccus sp. 3-233 TaxID=3417969 RepID=UPI003D3318E7
MNSILIVRSKRSKSVGGTELRSSQIQVQAHNIVGFDTQVLEYPGAKHIKFNLCSMFGIAIKSFKYLREFRFGLLSPLKLAILEDYIGKMKIIRRPNVIFWEPHTDPLSYAGIVLRRLWPEAMLIAFPHNVESLVPRIQKYTTVEILSSFNLEVAALSHANVVAGISQFDTHMYDSFGLASIYYPFSPTTARKKYLESIKARRKNSGKSHVIILGSAQNTPTYMGMLEQFKIIREYQLDIQFVLAGRKLPGEEKYNDLSIFSYNNPTDEELAELLVGAMCIWVHQAKTTGSLTRVSEALIMGLPVLGNIDAVRDFANSAGVCVYDDSLSDFKDELYKALELGCFSNSGEFYYTDGAEALLKAVVRS